MSPQVVKLNNGNTIPVIGLGTWQSAPGEVVQAVKDAIDIGYRHIDGAAVYQNEKEVGKGIADKIADGTVKREDLFITSKLWCTKHKPDSVIPACKKTLSDLGLSYLDLYLIHWPMAFKEGDELFPKDASGKILYSDVDYVDTWKQMEKCVESGLVKNIGLSNFNSQQIKRVLDVATIKPVINQIECHPYLQQKQLIIYCKENDIEVTAYSPLANPSTPMPEGETHLLKDPLINEIAKRKGKTVAQIIIRFLIQIGTIPIPKSVKRNRIQENFSVFDFSLTDDEVAEISKIDRKYRSCKFRDAKDGKDYPFNADF